MPEVSVKGQIRKLVELQKIDSEIYALKVDLQEKPACIEELKKKFEEGKAHLHALEEKLKRALLDRKTLELGLKGQEDEIAKANTQLTQIKTNREYQAKITEIESHKADKSVLEEKILVSYDETDVIHAEIVKEKTAVAGQEKQYLERKRIIEDEIAVTQDRVHVLESQKKQVLPEVDKNCLIRYEKILTHKNGLAIVPVQGSSCGGCFMNVTPQKINSIKMHDQLTECEMCQRILYIEDDF